MLVDLLDLACAIDLPLQGRVDASLASTAGVAGAVSRITTGA